LSMSLKGGAANEMFFFCRPLRSYDLRPAVEAGAAPAGEEGHVAEGDGVAALRQRPHRRAGPHLAVIPRRSQARGTKLTYISTVAFRALQFPAFSRSRTPLLSKRTGARQIKL
jgi:hypothetical protein